MGFDEITEKVTTPKQRVEAELADLNVKITALLAFIPQAKPQHQPLLLQIQATLMQSYAAVLTARLASWTN